MEKGLENIDKVFKQAFEGFEANVDPSIWSNIQSSIASGTGAESSVKPNSTTTSVVGKSLAVKLVAGVLAISSIVTGVYFIADNPNTEDEKIVNSYVVSDGSKEVNKVLSVEEKELKVDEPFKEVKKHLKEELLVAAVSLEQPDINVAQELVNLNADKVVSPYEENNEIKEESVAEVSIQNPIQEEVLDAVIEEGKPDVGIEGISVLKGAIRASVTKGNAPLDVSFDVEGEGLVSYSWDFGDNSEIDKEGNVFHTFKAPGRYKVELIVLDENANTETLIEYIEVESTTKPSLGFVPNAFSPNGDGHNDVFELTTASNIKTFNATVMSVVSGNVVFEWNSIDEGWDGNDLSGKKLDLGTYSLSIRAVGVDGETIQHSLMITIY